MLWMAVSLKLMAEVALMALAGRAVLGVRAGPGRAANPFWRILDWLVLPFERPVARCLACVRKRPATSPESTPAVTRWTALALALVWLLATAAKLRLCLALGVQACR